MIPDDEHMTRVQQGDEAAFDALLAAHEAAVRGRLARIVADHAAVEDLLQEVFLRLWSRAAQWDGRGSVRGWLLRTAVNLALNHLRTVKRRRTQSLEQGSGDVEAERPGVLETLADEGMPTPEQVVDTQEQARALREMVSRLPPAQQDVVRMAHEMEWDHGQIADELGIPTGTVKSRLHYARGRLADMWQNWQSQEEKWL